MFTTFFITISLLIVTSIIFYFGGFGEDLNFLIDFIKKEGISFIKWIVFVGLFSVLWSISFIKSNAVKIIGIIQFYLFKQKLLKHKFFKICLDNLSLSTYDNLKFSDPKKREIYKIIIFIEYTVLFYYMNFIVSKVYSNFYKFKDKRNIFKSKSLIIEELKEMPLMVKTYLEFLTYSNNGKTKKIEDFIQDEFLSLRKDLWEHLINQILMSLRNTENVYDRLESMLNDLLKYLDDFKFSVSKWVERANGTFEGIVPYATFKGTIFNPGNKTALVLIDSDLGIGVISWKTFGTITEHLRLVKIALDAQQEFLVRDWIVDLRRVNIMPLTILRYWVKWFNDLQNEKVNNITIILPREEHLSSVIIKILKEISIINFNKTMENALINLFILRD